MPEAHRFRVGVGLGRAGLGHDGVEDRGRDLGAIGDHRDDRRTVLVTIGPQTPPLALREVAPTPIIFSSARGLDAGGKEPCLVARAGKANRSRYRESTRDELPEEQRVDRVRGAVVTVQADSK